MTTLTTANVSHAHRHDPSQHSAPEQKAGRWTLSGTFLGIAITACLFAHLFSAYWLILAGFAFLGFTQSWSFDLAQMEEREQRRP